jgi:hypothetical protein
MVKCPRNDDSSRIGEVKQGIAGLCGPAPQFGCKLRALAAHARRRKQLPRFAVDDIDDPISGR